MAKRSTKNEVTVVDTEVDEPIGPRDPKLPTGYLSVSAVGTYLACGEAYRRRYVDQVKMPPAVALQEGKAHHAWLEFNNAHKRDTHEDRPIEECRERFGDEWSELRKECEVPDADLQEVEDRGPSLIQSYHRVMAPSVQPVLVEVGFDQMVGDVPMLGFIDLVEETETVIDYKVVGKKKTEADAANSIQLGIYATVTELTAAGFVSLVKPNQQIHPATVELTARQKTWAVHVVSRVAAAIKSGTFMPTDPANWKCSQKWCEYWSQCRGAKRLRVPKGLQVSTTKKARAKAGEITRPKLRVP